MKFRWIIFGWLVVVGNFLYAQNAPVTVANSLYGCTAGPITVPVTVTGFTSIGAISLYLEYDPVVLIFVQGIKNPSLPGNLLISDNILPSGFHRLIMSWFGSATLPAGSTLVNLNFNFIGGTTSLSWYDNGSSCEYANNSFQPLNDLPTACYYFNGKVTSDKLFQLGVFLEGLYDVSTHKMKSVAGNSNDPCTVAAADMIILELHNSTNYSTIEYTSPFTSLNVEGWSQFSIPAAKNNNYFLTIRHRNSVATVSALPVSFTGNIINYTFDASLKAYGNNMQLMADGAWTIFSGDVNQDGLVNSDDLTLAGNDAALFASGYIDTDINGDGIVDSTDLILMDNNSANHVISLTP